MKSQKYIITLLVAFFFAVPVIVSAANKYVRAGASGNGSDWTNAYGSLPATLTRGDTYYLADGNYGSYAFDDAESGTQWITVKKAIQSDHGTDTGWQNSYGDGAAEFSKWNFQTNYWEVDGQVGQWSSDWPGYVPYGFVVHRPMTDRAVQVGTVGNRLSFIKLKHVNAYFDETTVWPDSLDLFYSLGRHGPYLLLPLGAQRGRRHHPDRDELQFAQQRHL